MTLIKEKAVEMIRRMPEDNMLYVINILQNLEAIITEQKKDRQRTKEALTNILNMEKRLPDDFDAEKELHEARMRKFERKALSNDSLVQYRKQACDMQGDKYDSLD